MYHFMRQLLVLYDDIDLTRSPHGGKLKVNSDVPIDIDHAEIANILQKIASQVDLTIYMI